MKYILKRFNRGVDHVNNVVGWVLAVMLMIMTILIFWQVFARFVMGSPLTFSEEYSRFIMIWLTLLGAAYAFRKGSLISIDILDEYAPPKISKVVNTIVFLLSAVFAFVLIFYGFDMVSRVAPQTAPSTGLSMMWPNLSIPIGGIVILFNAVALIIDQYLGSKEGSH